MIRKTSIETYRRIEAEGLLSKLRFRVYSILYQHGPLTQGEVSMRYFSPNSRPSITPRFAELLKTGVVEIVGERECMVSGNKCYVWGTTDNLPVKLEKPKKIKCEYCDGKGHFIEQQVKMF